jgi:hypothetical protein
MAAAAQGWAGPMDGPSRAACPTRQAPTQHLPTVPEHGSAWLTTGGCTAGTPAQLRTAAPCSSAPRARTCFGRADSLHAPGAARACRGVPRPTPGCWPPRAPSATASSRWRRTCSAWLRLLPVAHDARDTLTPCQGGEGRCSGCDDPPPLGPTTPHPHLPRRRSPNHKEEVLTALDAHLGRNDYIIGVEPNASGTRHARTCLPPTAGCPVPNRLAPARCPRPPSW